MMTGTLAQSIRHTKRAVLVGLAPFLVGSCTDLTEVPQDSLTPNNAFKNEQEILAGVASVYAGLRGMMWAYYNLSEITTDELVVPTRGSDWYDNGRWLEIHRQGWAANSGSALDDMNGMWNDLFGGVARANLMISVIEQSSSPTKDVTLAELRTLRAHFYYQLQDMFGGVPLVTNTEVSQRPRATREEIYAFITTELNAARAVLPVSWPAAQKGRVTKGVADAILASVYLNAGVFNRSTVSATAYNSCTTVTGACQAAIDAANRVINSGQYSLASNWSGNFSTTNENSPENIFVVAHAAQPGLGMNLQMRGLHYNQLAPSPWNGFATLAETYRSFSPADARRSIFLIGQQYSYNTGAAVTDRTGNPLIFTDTINNVESAAENEGARLMKFPPLPGAADGNSHPNDFTLFRLAEMYLIRAEASNELGGAGTAAAISDINLVRQRHFSPPQPIAAGLTQAQVRDAILRERLFELAGEAKRRMDLIRFGQFTASRRICQANIAGCTKALAAPHKILMPIPQTQLQNNPLLTQNPGY